MRIDLIANASGGGGLILVPLPSLFVHQLNFREFNQDEPSP